MIKRRQSAILPRGNKRSFSVHALQSAWSFTDHD